MNGNLFIKDDGSIVKENYKNKRLKTQINCNQDY